MDSEISSDKVMWRVLQSGKHRWNEDFVPTLCISDPGRLPGRNDI